MIDVDLIGVFYMAAKAEIAFCADTPLGRMAEATEIAAPALFLLSDDASYIAAFDLLVDGGYTAW